MLGITGCQVLSAGIPSARNHTMPSAIVAVRNHRMPSASCGQESQEAKC